MTDRNTIIGLVLIFVVLIGYGIVSSPSKEDSLIQHQKDSIALVQAKKNDSLVKTQQNTTTNETTTAAKWENASSDSLKSAIAKNELGVFSKAAFGTQKFITLENEHYKLKISNKGGKIYSVELKNYKTFEGKPLILFTGDKNTFNLSFFAQNRTIATQNLYFEPFYYSKQFEGKDSIAVTGKDSAKFGMRMYLDSIVDASHKRYVEFTYTIYGNNFLTQANINFVGLNDVISNSNGLVNLEWNVDMPRQEKGQKVEKSFTTVYYKYANDDEVDYLSETSDDEEALKTMVKWISFKQQFFTSVMIADNGFNAADVKIKDIPNSKTHLKNANAQISMNFTNSSNYTIPFKFYFGPNHYNTLKQYDLDLERQVPLGWGFFVMAWINRFVVIPVFNFLEGFNINYGIIILILTILLKIVLFPIAYKTYLSSAKMKILKPEIEEINQKYPKKEEALKKQQATMELYKKAGVNPMAGCIPMLLQLPILLAMFRFFPASIELRQEGFLWANDLSSYDSIWNLPFNIPFYGDHVSLFALLMTISTIFYTKMNNDMMSSTNQMPGMKFFMYAMPVMLLGIFNDSSSGLSYYYLLANLITFAQMFFIRRMINEEKLHAKIQENKKKNVNVKKSGFQQRLEEMAKKSAAKRK